MPPKKHEEPPQEDVPRTASSIDLVRASVMENEDGELLCCAIMQEVVAKAEEQVLENYFDRTAIPYTVQSVCKELLDLVQFVFVARDAGDDPTEDNNTWIPDEEPQPCPTDTWSRGAIPVRRRTADSDPRKGLSTPGGTKRRDDPKRSTPVIPPSQTQQHLVSSVATASDNSKAKSTLPNKKAPSSHKEITKQPSQGTLPPEEDAVHSHKTELRKRIDIKEASERQGQLLREIKPGKEFTVDAINGKVIPIKSVDLKRLPVKRLDIRYEVDTAGDQPAKKEDSRRASAPNNVIVSKPTPNPTKKKGRREDKIRWSEHVQPEDTHGPIIVGAAPSGGVTLREGDSTQRNELKNPKGKVSRKEYKKLLDAMGVSREAVDMSADTPPQQEQEQAPPTAKPSPKDAPEKLAAGAAAQAVHQQQTPRGAGVGGGGYKQEAPSAPKTKAEPSTLKPQSIAPIPAHKKNNQTAGTLIRTKGGRNRQHNAGSPRYSDRPPPLPPSLYQSMPNMDSNTVKRIPSGTIQISTDIDGNQTAEDLFNSLTGNDEYNSSML